MLNFITVQNWGILKLLELVYCLIVISDNFKGLQ